MVYQVAICDDVREDASYIESLVNAWASEKGYVINVDSFPSAEAFWFQYEEKSHYDILLLDIEMGTMNGMELARKIRQKDEDVQILFITGFPDYMAEGYEVSALHYLMKPVRVEKLYEVLDRAIQNRSKIGRNLMVIVDGAMVRIPVTEICSVEAFAHTTKIITKERAYDLTKSITEMEDLLEGEVVRCHRSYLAGLSHIRKITKTAVFLDNGQELPLARSKYQAVNQMFITYYTRGLQ